MSEQLPHNKEAERAVLASLIWEPERYPSIAAKLTHEDFYRAEHKAAFLAIGKLVERKADVDLVSLREEVRRSNFRDSDNYLMSLTDDAPSPDHAEYHADLVRRYSHKRMLIRVAQDAINAAHNPDIDPDVVAASLTTEATKFTTAPGDGIFSFDKIIVEFMRDLEQRMASGNPWRGLRTGLERFDIHTSGLERQQTHAVVGYSSSGKTALALQLAIGFLDHNESTRGVIFSLEMGRMALAQRTVASRSRVNSKLIRSAVLDDEELKRVMVGASELSSFGTAGRLLCIDRPMTIDEIASACRNISRTGGLDFVMLDYIQLVNGPPGSESRHREVSLISKKCLALAKELNVTFVFLAQLNPEDMGRKRPNMYNIRDSKDLAMDARNVILVWNPAVHDRDGDHKKCEIEIEFLKGGEVGLLTIPAHFDIQTQHIREGFCGPDCSFYKGTVSIGVKGNVYTSASPMVLPTFNEETE